jgi:L-ascorbate metabolism protein UlaG (beta-lactamase superfamily)
MNLIQPVLQNEALKRDILAAPTDASTCVVWWLAQSGYLIKWNSKYLLLDPYLSDSLTHKYVTTDKPHTRLSALAIEPRELDFVDVVTSSHNHTDHLDAETLNPLFEANPNLQFVLPGANRAFAAERLGQDSSTWHGLDDGQSVEIDSWKLHGIAAAHNELDVDAEGRHKYLGLVVQFGSFTVYHSGDCLLYDGLTEKLSRFDVDLALLPINGNRPERKVAGNFDAREAAFLAREIGARLAVPCHYDLFSFNTADPQDFARECEQIGQPHRVLQIGESLSLKA